MPIQPLHSPLPLPLLEVLRVLNPMQVLSTLTDHILDMSKVHQNVVALCASVIMLMQARGPSSAAETHAHASRNLKLVATVVLSFVIDLMGSFGASMADVIKLPRAIVPTSEETLHMHQLLDSMWDWVPPLILHEATYFLTNQQSRARRTPEPGE